ncbi:MAG: type II secretion system protein GspG [Bdellovibrionales bacterium]|nr:type II secretion system protein GspG [Bdellovibrionales bacterium]
MMRTRHLRRKNLGLTLVEIVAVTILLALIAGGAIVAISGQMKTARINTAKSQIGIIENSVSLFEVTCGFKPNAIADLENPPTSRRCKGYPEEGFLEKGVPEDPWNMEYNFAKEGSKVRIWSNGPDGEEGTSDDVRNWETDDLQE